MIKGKVLSLDKFSAVAMGSQGALPPFWLTKITFFETLCSDKTADNDEKKNNNIESYCTYWVVVGAP